MEGREFCPCIWQGRIFHPPRYLQYRTWIHARNFSRSGSKYNCRKTDYFTGELIASYSFPLIYSLTLGWWRWLTCYGQHKGLFWLILQLLYWLDDVSFDVYLVRCHNHQANSDCFIAHFFFFLFQECLELSSCYREGSLPLLNWPQCTEKERALTPPEGIWHSSIGLDEGFYKALHHFWGAEGIDRARTTPPWAVQSSPLVEHLALQWCWSGNNWRK